MKHLLEGRTERKSLLAAVLLFMTGISAFAEEPDSIHSLDNVVITARREPLATSQTLSGKELEALSSTSIADALKYFAGVQIKDMGGLGGLKTINVRSMGSQHVGVYIDGIRITNAQNGTVDLGKYSLSTLESVRLYNANKLDQCQSASEYASGATVYLKTRRPQRDSLTVLGGIGSFHTYRGRVNGQLCRKGWSSFIEAEYLNSRGDYPFRYKSQYEDTVGRRANSDIEYFRVEGAAFHGGFSSHVYAYFSERGCPGGIVRRLSGRYNNVGREWDRDIFAQASYKHDFHGKHLLQFNMKYAYEYLRYNTDYPENQNTVRADNHFHQHDAYGSAAYAWLPFNWLSVNVGYDARMSWLAADLKHFQPVRRFDEKAVLALRARYLGFSFAGSVLFQHLKDYTSFQVGAARPLSRFTPSVSLAYTRWGVTLRAWYKCIFRAPTLNDLYYTQVGNRNLKPEYTRQWNLGVEYQYADLQPWMFAIQADGYINHIDNRIVCLPLKGSYSWSMMNYGKTYCRGLNATGTVRYTPRNWTFSLLMSLTWQKDLNRTNPEDSDNYDIPICYSPALSYGITAVAGWKYVTLTVSDLHVSKRMWSYADPDDMLGAYDNIDVKLTGAWRWFTASFEVNDLFDVQYEHIPRYPMPGRNFKFTLTYSL